MPSEWRELTWGGIATLEYGRGLSGYERSRGRFTVFGTNGPIGRNTEALCSHPTVVIGRKGAYRGVHYSPEPCYVIDTAFYLEPKVDLDMRWAYYQLLTMNINSMDSGSAIPSTSRGDFYALTVKFPPLPVQQVIARMLGALDDKIEQNRKMNETLEQMAQAIFRSWFVDFEPFRDKGMVDSALGDIPKGWGIRPIGEIAQVVDYVANGSFASLRNNVTLYDDPDYALYIRTTDFNSDFSGRLKYTDRQSYEFLRKSRLDGDDVVISNVGNTGTVFRPPSWLGLPMTLGSNAIALKCAKHSEYVYEYFCSVSGQEAIDSIVAGSAQPKFNKTDFRALPVLNPSAEALDEFNACVRPLRAKVSIAKRESCLLVAIRDALLPKLMSGEVRVA